MTGPTTIDGSLDRDQYVVSLLTGALATPVAERLTYLLSACEGDTDLLKEVTETLDWEQRMGRFLLEPVIQFIDLVRPFQAGQTISGRFEIIREIGEGGMGIVYEAFDKKRNQRVAIKSARPGFQRWLSSELESALSVRHPNICLVNEIHTAHTEQGEIDFLTMEFLEGETLYSRLSRCGPLDHDSASEIARQLCAALAEAHRSNIIHGDLKSSNVFLYTNPNGTIRSVIIDFGLARTTAAQDRETAGTPGYIAPEIWQGDRLSKASDVYALGVILYEMVIGRRPRPDIPPFQDKPVIRPSALRKGLDPRWDRAILPCLEPSKERRPAHPLQILAALDRTHLRKGRFALIVATVTTLFGSPALLPSFRRSVTEFFRPPSVRLAILPFARSKRGKFTSGRCNAGGVRPPPRAA